MHDGLNTNERTEVLDGMRQGEINVLVGVNLLREGIDLPQVLAILDADRAGFLRSETAIIQIVVVPARNVNAKAILYASTITGAMTRAIVETPSAPSSREHNRRHGMVRAPIVTGAWFTVPVAILWNRVGVRGDKPVRLGNSRAPCTLVGAGLTYGSLVTLPVSPHPTTDVELAVLKTAASRRSK